MTLPIAYSYEANLHCCGCAEKRFGLEPGRPWVNEDAVDNESNPVRPVFSQDYIDDLDPLTCGTCEGVIE